MKKTYISLFALLLVTSLLFSACAFVADNDNPAPSSTSTVPTQGTTGSEDNYTTDLDVFTDLIPNESSEPDTTEEIDGTSEATDPAEKDDTPPASSNPTDPEATEPAATEDEQEPVPPSPTNSKGEIELPMIPG